MTIKNLKRWKMPAALLTAALLVSSLGASPAYAAVSMSDADPVIRESNSDSTVIASFSPELGSTIQQGTSTDAVAYYGVVANSSASSSDVFWRITVSHATSSLLLGDVDITEKGWYDDFGHDVADSPYTPLVNLDGDLILTGNSGWGVEAGANFTNVDEIAFAPTAPIGEYTITRELMDNTAPTSTPMGGTHVITTTLLAAATSSPDTIAPLAPIVISPTSPHSTTTNPITVSGTAEPDSSIEITGGASDSSATTTGLGEWSASVNLNENATNTLMITATDDSNNTSSSTTLIVTHSASTTATTTPPTDDDDDSGGGGGGGGGSRRNNDDNDNPAEAFVLAGVVIDGGSVIIPGIPNTGTVLGISFAAFMRDLSRGMSGPDVLELQTKLFGAGIFRGPITGFFGPITEAAVRTLQQGLRLPVTGVLDQSTRNVLNNS